MVWIGSAWGRSWPTIAWPSSCTAVMCRSAADTTRLWRCGPAMRRMISVLEVGLGDEGAAAASGEQRRLVDDVGQVGAGESRRLTRERVKVDVAGKRLAAPVQLEDLPAPGAERCLDGDLAVEAARTQQRGIEDVGAVGGRDDDHAVGRLEAVHLHEQLVERLLALVVAAADARTAVPADRVDLVDEDDGRRSLLGSTEEVADTAGADADEHLDEV